MTDREILIEMLNRANIKFTDECGDGSIWVFEGYAGFFSVFEFNEDGSLRELSAGE